MKELINVLIFIPLLALAWIGYQRIFPEGFSAQLIPSVIQEMLPEDTSQEQEPVKEEDNVVGYTDQQLVGDASQEGVDDLKSGLGTSGTAQGTGETYRETHSESQPRDCLEQAQNVLDRLSKFGG